MAQRNEKSSPTTANQDWMDRLPPTHMVVLSKIPVNTKEQHAFAMSKELSIIRDMAEMTTDQSVMSRRDRCMSGGGGRESSSTPSAFSPPSSPFTIPSPILQLESTGSR
jgi:hypothetical protein